MIENLARECCAEESKKMTGPYFISYDGSWSSRRNASHCIVEFIRPEDKIVDFDYLSRAQLNGPKLDNYCGPSNKMEDIFVKRLANKWKNDSNLVCFVHDGDVKKAKFWHKGIGVFLYPVEFHDPGHMKKTVCRLFDMHNIWFEKDRPWSILLCMQASKKQDRRKSSSIKTHLNNHFFILIF